MRLAACGVLAVCIACRQQPTSPATELRRTVLRELPVSLTALAGGPRSPAWRCVPTEAEVQCIAGSRDSLRVLLESIVVDPDSVDGTATLTAIGVSASHYAPAPADVFEVTWTDRFRRTGTGWRRTRRTVGAIS